MKKLILVFIFVLVSNFVFAASYIVTNTNDSGAGSLRTGVATEGNTITFSIGGEIALSSNIRIEENNITIDGSSAPSVIELTGYGIEIKSKTSDNSNNVHDITIKNLRFKNLSTADDMLRIWYNAYNVDISHCSFQADTVGPPWETDGQIDITEGANNVEVSYCMFLNDGGTSGANLISFKASKISFHHNIYYDSRDRTPKWADRNRIYTTGPAIESPMMDARYNIIWACAVAGMVTEGAQSNVAYNLFKFIDFPDTNFFINDDNNVAGLSQTSEVYMNGNASVDDCTSVPLGKDSVNFNNNHTEFTGFSLTASGSVWPDKSGIVYEWQDALDNAGPDPENDDTYEATARAAITIPETTIWDEIWNQGSVSVDTTPPTVTAFAIPSTYTSIPVPVESFTATDNVAVTGYIVTASAVAPAYTESGWTPSATTALDFLVEGANTVYAWAKDAAGLVSLSATDDCTVTLPEPGVTWEDQPTWSVTWEDQPTWSVTWE